MRNLRNNAREKKNKFVRRKVLYENRILNIIKRQHTPNRPPPHDGKVFLFKKLFILVKESWQDVNQLSNTCFLLSFNLVCILLIILCTWREFLRSEKKSHRSRHAMGNLISSSNYTQKVDLKKFYENLIFCLNFEGKLTSACDKGNVINHHFQEYPSKTSQNLR